MKFFYALFSLYFLLGCKPAESTAGLETNGYTFYVGTYTESEAEGIYKYQLNADGSLERVGLAAKSKDPSFLTFSVDKKYFLTVNELDIDGAGTVESYLIDRDSLKLISRSSSGGAHPCFITVNEKGYVLVANYTGGNVGLLWLNDGGVLSPLLDVQTHNGSSTHKNQRGPHAHSVWFESVENRVISVDLGTNELWFSYLNTKQRKLVPSNPITLKMQPGAGPRHLAIHSNGQWIYVLNELDCTITLVRKSDDDKYIKGASVSTLPDDYTEHNSCADIHISSDGDFLYASNRGHNSLAIYDINEKDGSISLVRHQSTYGERPRSFALSPDNSYLLVANRNSNNIVSFKRNKKTGLLKKVAEIDAPTPVCILF
ncbi:lactonase family protein [Candidatus Neomarinimicrobiota bacterium]